MVKAVISILLLFVSVSVFAGQTLAPGQAPTAAELRLQYAANLAKAAKEQEESHMRIAKLLARDEAVMTRKERDLARYERILDTWERQQAQYQKYLDSLSKK